MKKQFFSDCMNDMFLFYDYKMDNKVMTSYWKSLSNVSEERLCDATIFLKENWKPNYGTKFPFVVDFNDALRSTQVEAEWKETEIPLDEQASKEDWAEFWKKINPLLEKDFNDSAGKVNSKQRKSFVQKRKDFRNRMEKENKEWNYKSNSWELVV